MRELLLVGGGVIRVRKSGVICLLLMAGGLACWAQQTPPVNPATAGGGQAAGSSVEPAGRKDLGRADVVQDAAFLEKHTNIAFLVGIGDYDRALTGLPPLKYPLPDIFDIGKVLTQEGYAVRLLEDGQATAGNIRDTFRKLSAELDKGEGTFLFYFSGHGFRMGAENYLATFGTTHSELEKQGMSLSEVQKLLLQTGAKRRMAFIDACRNDPEAKSVSSVPRSFADLRESEGLRVLYSTAPGEVSYEDDTLHHGVFSYFLIEGLRGKAANDKDGLITFDDLCNYVTREMKKYGIARGRIQKPYQLGESHGDFLLAKPVAGVAPPAGGEVEMATANPVPVGSGVVRARPIVSSTVKTSPRMTLERVGVFRTGQVHFATLSPDGQWIALVGADPSVQLWSVETGKPVETLTGPSKPVSSVEFSPDSKLLAAGGEKEVWLWEIESKQVHKLEDRGLSTVFSASFSSDRRLLVSSSADKTLRVWNVGAAKVEASVKLQTQGVWAAMSPDPRLSIVALMANDKKHSVAGLWNWGSKEAPLMLIDSAGVRCLAFSPDGRKLVAGMQNGTIRSWVLSESERPQHGYEFEGHTEAVESLAFSLDGTRLASAGADKTFRWWNPVRAAQLRSLDVPPGTERIIGLSFLADGRLVAATFRATDIEIWRVPQP